MNSLMFRTRFALMAIVVLATVGLAAAAITSAQSPSSITLKVKGKSVIRHGHFCHKSKTLKVFPRGTLLKYRGFVTPHPAKHFPVLVQVRRCVRGRFVNDVKYHFQGKRATGKYKAYFRAPSPRGRISYFYARTVVGGRQSAKTYFAVHR
jgi:hypothetical protein